MTEDNQEQLLELLREVDFAWTMHVDSVWRDPEYHVPELQKDQRNEIINRIRKNNSPKSPLGIALLGQGGAGKTHLLNSIRQYSASQGFGFILVDMTDVYDFWSTVLQGYVSSLQQSLSSGVAQFQQLINSLASYTNLDFSAQGLSEKNAFELKNSIDSLLRALSIRNRTETLRFQNTLRALILLNSNELDISGIGYNYLLGCGVEDADRDLFGFTRDSTPPKIEIVKGLSWLMSLQGSTVLAFDQLDSIVTQHHFAPSGQRYDELLSDEQRVSRRILESIAGGLGALRDVTTQTQIIVSCLDVTWRILTSEAVSTFQDRFSQLFLDRVLDKDIAKRLIIQRLSRVYNEAKFTPPYSTWPFSEAFFEEAAQQYPRRILQRCDSHLHKCLRERKITELVTFDDTVPPPPSPPPKEHFEDLDRDFASLKQDIQATSDIDAVIDQDNEDKNFAELLQTACECLIHENQTPDNIDVALDIDFPGGSNYSTLHARVRLIFHDEGDREQHLCLRALQRTNARAYQTRMRAAMIASGIDRALSFRRLIIVRTNDIPGGSKTQELTQQFYQAGGIFAHPSEDELITLMALLKLKKQGNFRFNDWLSARRPASQLAFLQDTVTWLFGNITEQNASVSKSDFSSSATDSSPSSDVTRQESALQSDVFVPIQSANTLQIGRRLIGGQEGEIVSIPIEHLTKHTVILAGSGSGKTVLVRRLVEEAALLGIPSIVVDCANDLAGMGDPWPEPPSSWNSQDLQKATQYHETSEVIVWTPGYEAGNPLNLEPLPDLAALVNDQDELDQAADMARDWLQEIVAPGRSQASSLKRGILKAALLYLARHGGGRLTELIDLLSDLPPDASRGITNADRMARAMADSLRAEILNNRLLRQTGTSLDPAILFGLNHNSSKARISILNFVGLSSLGAQQQFLNQLFMGLFTWIKKNPAPKSKSLTGLLVIDEAKDFVPSTQNTPCKSSLIRLVSQARKYGLGLIFATQTPRSIDHNIIANCSTQFYGRVNSPAAIDTLQELLRQRGSSGQDIARLSRGQFYAVSESISSATKVSIPLCLSHHPTTPLDEQEVLRRARSSRSLVA